MRKKRQSLAKTFFVNMVIISVAGVGMFMFSGLRYQYQRFRTESDALRHDYLTSQQWRMMRQADQIIEEIRYRRAQAETRLQRPTRDRATGEYEVDRRTDIQRKVIERVVSVSLGKGDHLFISASGGDLLMADGRSVVGTPARWNLLDSTGRNLLPTVRKISRQPDGGYLTYSAMPGSSSETPSKLLVIKGIPEWQWIVGIETDLAAINRDMAQKEAGLRADVRFIMTAITLQFLTIILVITVIARYYARNIHQNFQQFAAFFESAAVHAAPIAPEQMYFTEFMQLAAAANQMLDKRNHYEQERQQREDTLCRYAARLQRLHTIDTAILDARSPETVARIALRQLRELLDCQRASIVLLDEVAGVLSTLATDVADGDILDHDRRMPLDETGWALIQVFRQGSPHIVEDLAALPRRNPGEEQLFAAGFHSYFAVPMPFKDQLIGTVNLSSKRVRTFTQEQIDIVQEVAVTLAIAIQQARLREQIQRQSAELEQRVADRTAQLEAANHELEAFSYSVSHDLRAPLRHINMFGQALAEDYAHLLDDHGKEYISTIQSSTKKMAQLIEDLLKLSRITRHTFQEKAVNLSQIVQALVADLHHDHPERAVTWHIQECLIVSGDSHLLTIALQNLLDNAWKFSSKTPAPEIEFGTAERDGKRFYVVRDNGAGFDMKRAGKLFGAFQRLHKSDEFPGTGIGLSIVQRIIHRHGGEIWAESLPGQGATFYFSL